GEGGEEGGGGAGLGGLQIQGAGASLHGRGRSHARHDRNLALVHANGGRAQVVQRRNRRNDRERRDGEHGERGDDGHGETTTPHGPRHGGLGARAHAPDEPHHRGAQHPARP